MRFIAWLMIIITAISTAFADTPEEAWVMCQPDSELIVRFSPSRHSQEVARVFPGDRVVLTGRKRGRWYEICGSFENGTGWIRSDYLSFSEPEVFPGGKRFKTNRGKLVSRMSIKGNVRNKFKKPGVQVVVYLMADEWSVTDHGYVMTKYLGEADGS